MFINGIKFACSRCVKGHRSSKCNHTDRPIFEIRKKGRPVTQCSYCRELRKTHQFHIKCPCTDKTKRINPSSENLAYSTLFTTPSNAIGRPPCIDCEQQSEKQPFLVNYMSNLDHNSNGVLSRHQRNNHTFTQCSCHEMAAKLLKASNDTSVLEKSAATTTSSTTMFTSGTSRPEASTSNWSSSVSTKFSAVNLAVALPLELKATDLQAQVVPSLSSEPYFVCPKQSLTGTNCSIYEEQITEAAKLPQRKASLSRKMKSATKSTMEHKKRRSTISAVPILPQHQVMRTYSNSEGTAVQWEGLNSGGTAANKVDDEVGQLQPHLIDYFSPKVALQHPEEQQAREAHDMLADSEPENRTFVAPNANPSSVGLSAQSASHDSALSSSAPLPQLPSFSNPFILPPPQDNDNDDIIMTHSCDNENRNINLDKNLLMSDRNTSLSLLNNANLPQQNQGVLLPGGKDAFCQQQNAAHGSIDMTRSATTGSTSSSASSIMCQQQPTLQQTESDSPAAIAPSSFANDQQQGESVMITITPLSSLIDTLTGNLLLETNDNNAKPTIAINNSSTSDVGNFTASTVTRIVTCYNGSECNCPGCFVHLNNKKPYGASASVQNTIQTDQQSSMYLQQQQSIAQPYYYPLLPSNGFVSSNYSSDEEEKQLC